MASLRALLLCATTVLAPLAAVHAADLPGNPMVLYDAAGHPVAMLTPIQPRQAAAGTPAFDVFRRTEPGGAGRGVDPVAQLIAEQVATMQRLMANFGAWPFAAGPGSVTDVAIPAGGGFASCSETIVVRGGGVGAAPQMVVHRSGNACGAMRGPQGAPGAGTEVSTQPAPAAPTLAPGQHLYTIEYQPASPPAAPPLRG